MYFGGILTIIAFPIWDSTLPPASTLLAGGLLLLPGGIDGTTQMFGGRESTNGLRAVTGFLLGIGVVLLFHGVIYTVVG
jgi:uncharacterized membrane protein